MLFVRTSSGIAAKPIFISSGYHAEIPPSPIQQDSRRKKKPRLDWIGGLKEYRDQYTALELQKEALDWRD